MNGTDPAHHLPLLLLTPTTTRFERAAILTFPNRHIPGQHTAAVALLDEKHDRPCDFEELVKDRNSYAWGQIAEHNIVIASPTTGVYGTDSAAMTATLIISSFPQIRISLMVGIGGGIPRPMQGIDIRLGDVVVSQPSGQYGGVAQCDFRNARKGDEFQRMSFLNSPPPALREALARLQAKHKLFGSSVPEIMEKMFKKYPSMRQAELNYAYPGKENDRLFKSTYLHTHGQTCDDCDQEQEVTRKERKVLKPEIHYGLIVSGNTVIKDSATKDAILEQLGDNCICFEMEAAGLMKNFPCLVIRGICDYVDSHQNSRWPRYAAATAAAYAKEFLGVISRQELILEPRAGDIINNHGSFTVPFARNHDFVGRESILRQLLERIPPMAYPNDCQRTAVEGLGGIGKTWIVLEAVYRVREQHPNCSIFWVPVINVAAFENSYREIGQQLGVKGIDEDKVDVKPLVKAALSQQKAGSWLLVVDNADDSEVLFGHGGSQGLADFLPFSRQGSILFTTRSHELVTRLNILARNRITVKGMTEAEARGLLRNGLEEHQMRDTESTGALLELLAHYPLAVKQASAYMGKTRISTAKYLNFCRSSDGTLVRRLLSKGLEDRGQYIGIQNGVATTWLISFQHLSRENPLAAKYLKFICFLAEKDIPASLLLDGDDMLENVEAIGEKVLSANHPDTFRSIDNLALILRSQRKYQEAEMMYRQALALREKMLGEIQRGGDDAPASTGTQGKSASSMNNLALVLDGQGKRDIAEKMHRQTLEIREKTLGPEHPDTLTSTDNLALVLGSRGHYDIAEKIHRQTLETRKKVLGPEHPDTLTRIDNLALVLSGRGKCEVAEKMHRRTLELREKVLGPEHPDTLTSMDNLAFVLGNQRNYDMAEKTHWETLEMREKVLGPEHPDTLTSMDNLARILSSQGKYEVAEKMILQTLELREKVLGLVHPETLTSMKNFALALCRQREDSAEQWGQLMPKLKKRQHPGQNIESLHYPPTQAELMPSGNIEVISDSESEASEASSILGPSRNTTSSLSSDHNEPSRDAAMQFVDILYHDSVLRPFYLESIESLSSEKFCKRHNALLQDFFNAVDFHAHNSPYLPITQILRSKSQRQQVTKKLWELFSLMKNPQDADKMDQFLGQRVDRMNSLNALLKSLAEQGSIRLLASSVAGMRGPLENSRNGQMAGLEGEENSDDDEEEEEDEDEGGKGARFMTGEQNLSHLQSVVSSLAREPAFDVFRASMKYLVSPPTTLSAALSTRNVNIVRKLLAKRFTEVAQGEYDWILELDEIGLSRHGIAALLLDKTEEITDTASFRLSDRKEWLKSIAVRLGDRFSRTNEMTDLEDAIKTAQIISKTSSDLPNHAEWLNSLGSRLKYRREKIGKRTRVRAIIFEWEIPSVFLDKDHLEVQERDKLRAGLSDFVVLAGSDGAFEAATCAQYMEEHFGDTARKVLDSVAAVLEHVDFDSTAKSIDAFEGSVIRLEGGSCVVRIERVSRFCATLLVQGPRFPIEFIAAMQWLCEAVRAVPEASHKQRVPRSSVFKSRGFRSLEVGIGDEAAIVGFSLEPLRQMTDKDIGLNDCWVKLFKSAVVAWKPLRHSWGAGLKLPYAMLVNLAAVTNYFWIQGPPSTSQLEVTKPGGLIALGFFTALIPVTQDLMTNSIQWHLEVADNSLINPDELEILKGNWLKVKDSEIFEDSQCFLGWREHVNVLLGTTKGHYDLQWTALKKKERLVCFDELAMGGEVGVGDILPITLKSNLNLIYKPRSTIKTFTPPAHYDQAIWLLSRHVAFIYDAASQTAWLVPQLSWILHLCHVWYRHVTDNKVSNDPIPFASPSTDGSSAAREALSMQGDLSILPNITLSQLFVQITSNMAITNKGREKPKRLRIYGPETMDLIEEPGTGSPLRELRLPPESHSWLCLVQRADTIWFCNELLDAAALELQKYTKGLGRASRVTCKDRGIRFWSPDAKEVAKGIFEENIAPVEMTSSRGLLLDEKGGRTISSNATSPPSESIEEPF
ncbi:hypothetical protein DL768_001341 [Monosporascus sp. mg162]|nr:hypothetical protein DL768_001341 [Monosporascus sp. mg162]